MAKITGLSIPDGLETLFARALQSKSNLLTDYLGLTLPKQNHAKAKFTAGRSYVVQLLPYYTPLTSTQKSGWAGYWSSLPFGSHSGAGGWPGSGYSAFVYVNAPLLKAGLDLVLDAPSLNLIPNPTFLTSLNWWDFEDTADWEDHDGFARCTGGTNGLFSGSLSSPPGGYNLQFDVSNSNDGNITIYDPSSFVFVADSPLADGHFNENRLAHSDVEQLVFSQNGWTGDITNVHLIYLG